MNKQTYKLRFTVKSITSQGHFMPAMKGLADELNLRLKQAVESVMSEYNRPKSYNAWSSVTHTVEKPKVTKVLKKNK